MLSLYTPFTSLTLGIQEWLPCPLLSPSSSKPLSIMTPCTWPIATATGGSTKLLRSSQRGHASQSPAPSGLRSKVMPSNHLPLAYSMSSPTPSTEEEDAKTPPELPPRAATLHTPQPPGSFPPYLTSLPPPTAWARFLSSCPVQRAGRGEAQASPASRPFCVPSSSREEEGRVSQDGWALSPVGAWGTRGAVRSRSLRVREPTFLGMVPPTPHPL